MLRFYLAGPEVFLRDPHAVGEAKKQLCRRAGVEGVFPLDSSLDLAALAPRQAGLRISAANEELMRSCQAAIANLTPFRGPGMDAGTAYELGFMRALGRPVFGYSNRRGGYSDRVIDFYAGKLQPRASGEWEDPEGLLVENFGMHENLMIEGAIVASGGSVVVGDSNGSQSYSDLRCFEAALQQAVAIMGDART
ncbi:MAG: nucleoside 2-deoxyribosyltransferase [Leptospirales bacterium]|nr:nucleoside 2-deoxyribosyltransferase [Leptospirales bacterium]